MENITFEVTKTQCKIFQNDKHIKSFPRFFEPLLDYVIEKALDKLDEKRKRLTDEDYKIIGEQCFDKFLEQRHKFLQKHEKYVFELIQKAKCLGARVVKSRTSGERFELVYDNNHKIRCEQNLFKVCPNKLEPANLNY